MKNRELLFSVKASDCKFQATKGSGAGGQHRNKVSTAIRVTHEPSGAVGYACDERSQHHNKRIAFRRMAESKEMQAWIRMEAAKRTGELEEIERRVSRAMNSKNIRVEVKDENGRWMESDLSELETSEKRWD